MKVGYCGDKFCIEWVKQTEIILDPLKTKVTSKGQPSKYEKSSNGETQGKVPVMWMFSELGRVDETSSCTYQTFKPHRPVKKSKAISSRF